MLTKWTAGIEPSVHVLTEGIWPTYPLSKTLLPPELAACQDMFKDFYLSKYSGKSRRLT